jgi:hypothetical protein
MYNNLRLKHKKLKKTCNRLLNETLLNLITPLLCAGGDLPEKASQLQQVGITVKLMYETPFSFTCSHPVPG